MTTHLETCNSDRKLDNRMIGLMTFLNPQSNSAAQPCEVMSEVGSLKSEVGSRKSEVGSRKSEVGSRKSEVGSRKPEAGSRKSEVGSLKSEVGSRKSLLGFRSFSNFCFQVCFTFCY